MKKEKYSGGFKVEIFDAICEELAEGSSLKKACQKVKGAPDERLVRAWVRDDVDGCADKYARAREIGADKHFDDILDAAKEAEGLDNAGVQAKRLYVDTLKWALARMAPWKYGDKLELTGRLTAGDAPRAIEYHVVKHEPPALEHEAAPIEGLGKEAA